MLFPSNPVAETVTSKPLTSLSHSLLAALILLVTGNGSFLVSPSMSTKSMPSTIWARVSGRAGLVTVWGGDTDLCVAHII